VKRNASLNAPTERFKFDAGEPQDGLLEQSTHPDFFSLRRDESGRTRFLSGERQLEGELCERGHEAVCFIIPADPIDSQIGSGRP
jgi:hypothetical protein